MQLVMYLGNEFIASIQVSEQQLKQPGYLGNLKRRLLAEHSLLVNVSHEKPEFMVVNFSKTSSPRAGR